MIQQLVIIQKESLSAKIKLVAVTILFLMIHSCLHAQTSPVSESFSNIGPYGGYQTETWTGDNGGTWTATDARTDQTINGKAITVRDGELSSPNVSGGIGSLTVTTQREFSGGTGNMALRVNGVFVGSIPYDGTQQTTTINNINTSGNVTVVIDATNSSSDRVAIDDLSWTAYSGGGAAVFWSEPFDNSTQYSVSLGAEGNDGSNDYFMRTDGSNINKSYSGVVGDFFAGQDIDNTGWSGSASPSQLTWSSINISGQTNMEFTGLLGEYYDSPGDIDKGDSLLVEYRIDAGSWQNLIAFKNDGSTYNSNFFEDTDFDGTGDGINISDGNMHAFTKSIAGTGSSMDVRFTAAVNSGDEDFAIDEFQLEGTSSAISITLTMSDDGSITEGNEDAEQITVSISGDTLVGSLDITNWTFSNLPAGVSVSNLSRTNDTAAALTLSGNASKDYDDDITNFSVEIVHQEFKNLSSGSESVSTGVTFTATDDAESISMSDDGTITEGAEDGEVISVNLSGGTFADPLSAGNWSLSGQPTGVSLGNVNRISATQAEVSLSGNASSDYDTDITNAELQIDAAEIDDHSGADITAATGITFTAVIEPAPTVQASDINFTGIGANSIDLSWTRGNGEKVLLLVSGLSQVDSLPENGMDYTANAEIPLGDTIGQDEYVAYEGTGTSASITGLTQGARYHFRLFEFNNNGPATRYLTSTAALNPDSAITSPNDITNFSVDCISKTTADLSWTPPTGVYEGIVITIREDNNYPHVLSGKGDTISADTVFGDGYEYGGTSPKSYVVYNGTGNHVSVSGLNPGVEYTFKAYTYNGTSWSDGTSKSPQNTVIPEVSSVSHYAPNNKMVINWNNPVFSCVDEVMVVVRENNPVTGTPTGDGSSYTANASFGSGSLVVPNEYVVYKGNGNHVDITGLNNGTTYYFKIFVRDGTEWSNGVDGDDTPDDITILFPGDLVVVAVNTNYKTSGGGDDEISLVAFDTIKTNTAIDFTDNGWERDNPDQWGNTEGTIRFTRSGPDILPGEVFTFRGSGHSPGDYSAHGLSDNSWTVSSLNGNYDLNLNASDQIWVMQYGNWTSGSTNNHDAMYSGNILYGWTATGWAGHPAHAAPGGTGYSELYPQTNCFNANVVNTTFEDKVKYTGPTSAATRRTWIQRINNSDNWTGYDKNGTSPGGYGHSSTPQYSSGVTFNVLPDTLQQGEWIGDVDSNWYYCGNWGDMEVPDENTDVVISHNSQNEAVISYTADYSDDFNDSAFCRNLSLNKDSLILKSSDDIFNIHGDLYIDGGVLSNNAGKIRIRGDWQNISNDGFVAGSGIISFSGDAQQNIENTQTIESFQRLYISNDFDVRLLSPIESDSLVFTGGRLLLDDYNLTVNTAIRGADQTRYLVNKNNNSSAGQLIMEAQSSPTLFPVGTSASYTPVTITANSSAGVFKVRTFDGLRENGYSGANLSGNIVERSWAIELNSAPTADVNINLQWNITEEKAGFGSSRNSALMIQNPGTGSGSLWDDWNVLNSSNGSVSGSNPFSIEADNVLNFGVFGISEKCEILKPDPILIYHY